MTKHKDSERYAYVPTWDLRGGGHVRHIRIYAYAYIFVVHSLFSLSQGVTFLHVKTKYNLMRDDKPTFRG